MSEEHLLDSDRQPMGDSCIRVRLRNLAVFLADKLKEYGLVYQFHKRIISADRLFEIRMSNYESPYRRPCPPISVVSWEMPFLGRVDGVVIWGATAADGFTFYRVRRGFHGKRSEKAVRRLAMTVAQFIHHWQSTTPDRLKRRVTDQPEYCGGHIQWTRMDPVTVQVDLRKRRKAERYLPDPGYFRTVDAWASESYGWDHGRPVEG